MSRISHWLAPAVLGVATIGASSVPAPVYAQGGGEFIRILVDTSDVIFRSGTPYWRNGNDGYNDRLVVVRDRYGRPVYYRNAPRYGNGYAYGNRHYDGNRQTRCDSRGRCTTHYYDARYDRNTRNGWYDNRYDNRYYDQRYSRHDDRRRWDRHDDD